MKVAIISAAAIALLRSVAAALPQHIHQNQELILVDQDVSSANLDLPKESGESNLERPIILSYPLLPPSDNSPSLDSANDITSNNVSPISIPSDKADVSAGSTNSQWAIAYHPYNDDTTCKDKSTIQSDVAKVARLGFATIRLYSNDCSTLKNVVLAATANNLTLILGIDIDASGLESASTQIDEIVSWAAGDWNSVEMIVVGNEAIFNDFCPPRALAAFILSARATLRKEGYTGPITTTEPIPILLESAPDLCPVLDISASNIHPFFHPEVSAENAGAYVAQELVTLQKICPDLEAVNMETGWPRRGVSNGVARPGQTEQAVAINSIMREVGGKSVLMGFGDDGWKDEGEFGVEGSWGCGHLFGGERS